MVTMRLLLLTIFSALTAISVWLQCGSCFLLYSRRGQRYQCGCNAALASYYILGGDSDTNMVAMRLLLFTIFSAVTAIPIWLQYILGGDSDTSVVAMRLLLLTIFSAVTAIPVWLQCGSCFLLYSRR